MNDTLTLPSQPETEIIIQALASVIATQPALDGIFVPGKIMSPDDLRKLADAVLHALEAVPESAPSRNERTGLGHQGMDTLREVPRTVGADEVGGDPLGHDCLVPEGVNKLRDQGSPPSTSPPEDLNVRAETCGYSSI